MEICGKCGREPWDGRCNLLMGDDIRQIIAPKVNQQTRKNCGHPAIGESPLIIKAAQKNKTLRLEQNLRVLREDPKRYMQYLNPKNYQP